MEVVSPDRNLYIACGDNEEQSQWARRIQETGERVVSEERNGYQATSDKWIPWYSSTHTITILVPLGSILGF